MRYISRDYRLDDGAGEIRIDIANDLDQNLPLCTCMIIVGVWTGTEVDVEAYASCAAISS